MAPSSGALDLTSHPKRLKLKNHEIIFYEKFREIAFTYKSQIDPMN